MSEPPPGPGVHPEAAWEFPDHQDTLEPFTTVTTVVYARPGHQLNELTFYQF